jgi:hypothetical protein
VSELVALRPADVDQDAYTLRLLDTKSGAPQTRGYHPDADDALSRRPTRAARPASAAAAACSARWSAGRSPITMCAACSAAWATAH